MRDIDPCELLRYCPIDVPASIERSGGQYTLMLGDRILAKDRTALPIVPNPLNPFAGDEPSGSAVAHHETNIIQTAQQPLARLDHFRRQVYPQNPAAAAFAKDAGGNPVATTQVQYP